MARGDKQRGSYKAQGRQSRYRFNRLVGDFSWAVEIASVMNYAMSYVRRALASAPVSDWAGRDRCLI
jgi:hypothetical protein